MFVHYFALLEIPMSRIADRLASAEFQGVGARAYREGETMRAKLPLGRMTVAKEIRVRPGPPRHRDQEMTIPITWEATGSPGLFPRMEADVVLAAVGDSMTQLTFNGSYEPPLASVGRALDRAILHRIAEATVKAFVDDLAGQLMREESVPSTPSTS